MQILRKILIVALPLFVIFVLFWLFEHASRKFLLYLFGTISTLLIAYLWILLKVEGGDGLPLDAGNILTGGPFIISLSGTLITLFIFLLGMLKLFAV